MYPLGGGVRVLAQFEPPGWLPYWLRWFYNLGRFIVDEVWHTLVDSFTIDRMTKVLIFISLLISFYFLGKLAVSLLRRSVMSPPRVDAAVSRLLSHLIIFGFILLGFSAGLTVFGTSLAALATGLGLLSLALGFGMQNTVANIMGGMSLAIDKPFRIGDRIQVGDYWGTVQVIGLRSTRIETPRKETVIIPNKIMEEREIWNYTLGSPEYRLDIDVGISYDSDWRLAERILLEVSEAHPNILHYPPSRVLLRKFGDSSVSLQLRSWIADVTVRADTISDILKATKDRFDREGVEIPYPYRTVVYKTDLRQPTSKTDDFRPFRRQIEGMKEKVLVAVAGPQPVRERATFVASLAKATSAGVVALYIQRPGTARTTGEDALRILGDVIRAQRIWYKPVVRSGEIVSTIRDVAREEDVDLILVGAGRGGVSTLWKRTPEVGSRLRRELARPVFTVPKDLKLTPQLVAWLKEQMRLSRTNRHAQEQGVAAPETALPAAPSSPKPPAASEDGRPGHEPSESTSPPAPDQPDVGDHDRPS